MVLSIVVNVRYTLVLKSVLAVMVVTILITMALPVFVSIYVGDGYKLDDLCNSYNKIYN